MQLVSEAGLLMRAPTTDARVALAFPGAATFMNLATRVTAPLRLAASKSGSFWGRHGQRGQAAL